MENLILNGVFILCVLAALSINSVLVKKKFFAHVDFTSNRYFHLDGIRGIAALGVVMNHVVFSLHNNGYNPQSIDTAKFWIFAHAGDFGVQIFFCITGFLFFDKIFKSGNSINWSSYFTARIMRLVPMYLIATTIVLMLTLLWSSAGQSVVTTVRQAINLYGFGFFGSDIWVNGFRTYSLNAVIWTLPYEWKFYCILPFICAIIRYRSLTYLSILLVSLYAFNDLYSGDVVWVYFITGAVSALLINKINFDAFLLKTNKKHLNILSSFFCVGLIVFMLNSSLGGYGYQRFIIASALFVSIVILKPSILTFRPLVYLGEASYSSYLLHLVINALVIRSLGSIYDFNGISSGYFWLLVIFLVSVTTVTTAYAFKHIEYRFMKK